MRWLWSGDLLGVDARKVPQAEGRASVKALRLVVFEEVRRAEASAVTSVVRGEYKAEFGFYFE